MKPRQLALILTGALIAVYSASSAFAATFYWDNNGSTVGFGNAGGTWAQNSTSGGRWTTSSGGTAAGSSSQSTNASHHTFNFGSGTHGLGSGTINVNGSVLMGSTTYSSLSGNIVLSGGTINMYNGKTITVDNTSNTINSVIGGATDSLTKDGTGELIFGGANTYTGDTIISGGTLSLNNVAALGGTGAISMAGGTNLNAELDGITINAPITLSGAATVLLSAGGTANHTLELGALGGTGGLTLRNTAGANPRAIFTLNGASTYTGNTTLDSTTINSRVELRLGTNDALPATTVLTIDGGNGTGSGRTADLNMNGNDQTLAGLTNTNVSLRTQRVFSSSPATLTVNDNGNRTFSGLIGNGGSNISVVKGGSGTWTLSGANSYVGTTTLNQGTLSLGDVDALGNTSAISMAGGTNLNAELDGITINAPITLSGAATVLLSAGGTANHTLELGALGGTGGLTLRNTAGANPRAIFTLNGASTYTGNTTLDSTTINSRVELRLGTNDALPATTVLTIDGGNGTGSGRTADLNMNGNDQTLAGLTNTAVSARTQRVFSSSPAILTVNDNGNRTFSGLIGNGGSNISVVKGGSGTWTLSGANSYVGTTTLNGGTLSLGDVDALGNTGAISMAGGTTLAPTLDGISTNAPITIGGTGTTATINAPSNNPGSQVYTTLALGGAIGGDGNVSFESTLNSNQLNSVLLTAQSNYLGSTFIDTTAPKTGTTAGAHQIIVRLGIDNALPTTTVLTIDGGNGAGSGRVAELNLNGYNQELAGLTNVDYSSGSFNARARIQRVVNADTAAAATLRIAGSTNTTFSGNLGEPANFDLANSATPGASNGNNFGLSKDGNGAFTLSSANTYTGATTVSGGTLLINGSISTASLVSVENGATLGGIGTVGGHTTVASGGNLTPGASVGTLTFTGDLDISAQAGGPGLLEFELDAIAASDRIDVGGTLTIGSGALGLSDFDFTDLGGLENGVYTLISSPGPISGTLATGDTRAMFGGKFIDLQISADGSDLELLVRPPTTTVVTITRTVANPLTNSTSVSWDVTFADPVSDLTAGNFLLTGMLSGSSSITGVQPGPGPGSGSSTVWMVTAATGGCGTLGLDLTDGTGTTPQISNVPFAGEVYNIDTVAPVISCAKQIVVTVEEGQTATVEYAPTAYDECQEATIPVTTDPASGSEFAIGNHVVTATATDAAGNVGTATFNVVVLVQQPVNSERTLEGVSVRGDAVAAGTGIGPDAVILSIGSAFLNDGGDVVFDANLQNNGANSSAVFFRPDGGSPAPVAVKGNSFGAGSYGIFSNLSLNDAGGIGFQSLTSGNLPGHFAGPGAGPVANSALRLGAAPTGVAGEVYNGLYQPALASNGELLTPAALLLGGGGVSSTSDTLITSSAGTVLAREGSATGTGDLTHGQFLARVVASDADGHYAFPSLVFGSTPAGGNAGIFVGQLGGGSPSIAVRKGDAAADTPGTFGSFLGESVNSDGEIALRAFAFGGGVTAADNEGIWTNSGNASAPPVLVAREGDVVECIGEGLIAFGSFKTVYMGDDGSVCFLAYLRDATTTPAVFPSNDASIWLWRNGVLDLIVREGDTANSTDSCMIARLVDFDSNGDAAGGNGIVYSVDFVPGIGDASSRTNQAVYVDRGGEDLAPVLVLRRGDSFDDGEDESDILSLRISTATSPSGSTGGLGRAINGDGDVLLNVGFTGSRSGIFVLSSPPEEIALAD